MISVEHFIESQKRDNFETIHPPTPYIAHTDHRDLCS